MGEDHPRGEKRREQTTCHYATHTFLQLHPTLLGAPTVIPPVLVPSILLSQPWHPPTGTKKQGPSRHHSGSST
eukprot:29376-Prorocentrum_lima.AAC.1